MKRLLPFSAAAALVAVWFVAAQRQTSGLFPDPLQVLLGLVELLRRGLLVKYVVASLFRVTWGYLLAVVIAIPLGLLLGWYRRGELALNPILQLLRPISPLAWIPIAILWFGVGDVAAIFLIFLASFLPLTVAAMNAVRNVPPTLHVRAARNFGLSTGAARSARRDPAGDRCRSSSSALRIALGVAWLVVVAAEMIAVNSGLGFLIVDARNAGNRYDLVVAGMVMIGADRPRARRRSMRRAREAEGRCAGGTGRDAAAPKVSVARRLDALRDATAPRSTCSTTSTSTSRDGEFVCILGPSGCGKSTLLNIVGGFLAPTGGEVRIDGEPVRGPDPRRIFVFQERGVFPWLTVEGNIGFGLVRLSAARARGAHRALRQARRPRRLRERVPAASSPAA